MGNYKRLVQPWRLSHPVCWSSRLARSTQRVPCNAHPEVLSAGKRSAPLGCGRHPVCWLRSATEAGKLLPSQPAGRAMGLEVVCWRLGAGSRAQIGRLSGMGPIWRSRCGSCRRPGGCRGRATFTWLADRQGAHHGGGERLVTLSGCVAACSIRMSLLGRLQLHKLATLECCPCWPHQWGSQVWSSSSCRQR